MKLVLFFCKDTNFLNKIQKEVVIKSFLLKFVKDEKELIYFIEEFEPKYLILKDNAIKKNLLDYLTTKSRIKVIIFENNENQIAAKKEEIIQNIKSDKNIIFFKRNFNKIDIINLLHILDKLEEKNTESLNKNFTTNLNKYKFLNQQVISFYSTQGGVGRTTLALNFAFLLREFINTVKILLIDANFSEGCSDLYIRLNQKQINTLGVFIEKVYELPAAFNQSITKVSILKNFDIDIIFPPFSIYQSDKLTLDMINELICLAKKEYNVIIIDLPNRYDNVFLELLNLSTMIFLVSTPEINQIVRINNLVKILPNTNNIRKLLILNDRNNIKLKNTEIEKIKNLSFF